jgi:hypothetical protein
LSFSWRFYFLHEEECAFVAVDASGVSRAARNCEQLSSELLASNGGLLEVDCVERHHFKSRSNHESGRVENQKNPVLANPTGFHAH